MYALIELFTRESMVVQNLEKSHSNVVPSLKSRNIHTVAVAVLGQETCEYAVKKAEQAVRTADHYSRRDTQDNTYRKNTISYSEYCNTFSDGYILLLLYLTN